jgi:hypothetical protein
MSWKKSTFASSLLRLFGEATPEAIPESRIAHIRQEMLGSLADLEQSPQLSRLWDRILYARDIQTLWYLRSDMLVLLSGLLGESVARTRLAPITGLFQGLLPATQQARPGRLNS